MTPGLERLMGPLIAIAVRSLPVVFERLKSHTQQ
jgi:hypothetical protein